MNCLRYWARYVCKGEVRPRWKIGFLVHFGFGDFLELENPTPSDYHALSFSEM